MKIGDIITCAKGKTWIIFDFWGDFDEYCTVTDFETQSINELVQKDQVIEIKEFKGNWLFMKRREKNLAGLERFLK